MTLSIKNQQKKLPVRKKTVKVIARKILAKFGISRYKICIAFLDDKKIRRLNKKFLGKGCPTDVLAFPYQSLTAESGVFLWADIAISAESAIKNSRKFKASVREELCLYIIHGILHTLGFDDNTKVKRLAMEREQQRWLGKLRDEIKHLY